MLCTQPGQWGYCWRQICSVPHCGSVNCGLWFEWRTVQLHSVKGAVCQRYGLYGTCEMLYRGRGRGRRRASSGPNSLTNEENKKKGELHYVLHTIYNGTLYSLLKLKPSGLYMYRQFNIQQFDILPTQTVFMCFVWIWEQTAIISLYSINWLVCITETECVYCAVRPGSLYIIQVMCFVWIWE